MKHYISAAIAMLALAACDTSNTPSAPVDHITPAIAGKTLVTEQGEFQVNEDGTFSGGIEGTWEVVNGQFCRDLTKPERFKGKQCQDVAISGDQASFTRPDGSVFTVTIK